MVINIIIEYNSKNGNTCLMTIGSFMIHVFLSFSNVYTCFVAEDTPKLVQKVYIPVVLLPVNITLFTLFVDENSIRGILKKMGRNVSDN